MKTKSLKTNVILNSIRTLSGIIFPLITFPYASRILLPEGTGIVNYANSIVSIFAMIAGLGIAIYAPREASKLRDNKKELNKLVKEILTINFIATFISYLLFGCALFFIPKFTEIRYVLLVSSTTILFTTLGMEWIYRALEDFAYITLRSVVFQVISIVLLFTFVKTKDDYMIYCGIGVFSSVGSNILNFVHSRHFINYKDKVILDIKKHIIPIFGFFTAAIATTVYTALDSTMLGIICGTTEVGYYAAATKINRILLTLFTSIFTVMMPRLSFFAEKNDLQNYNITINKAIYVLLLILFPCLSGIFVLSKDIIYIVCGKEFIPAIKTMQLITPILFFIPLSESISSLFFIPQRKDKLTIFPAYFAAVINFIFNLILIPRYKANGAAIATVISESSVFIFKFFFIKKVIKGEILIELGKYIISTIIMTICIVIASRIIHEPIMRLFLIPVIGFFSYLLILIFLKSKAIYSFLKKKNN